MAEEQYGPGKRTKVRRPIIPIAEDIQGQKHFTGYRNMPGLKGTVTRLPKPIPYDDTFNMESQRFGQWVDTIGKKTGDDSMIEIPEEYLPEYNKRMEMYTPYIGRFMDGGCCYPMVKPKKAQQGASIPVNNTGYLKGSPTEGNPQNLIPSNRITMKGVAHEKISATPIKGGKPQKPVVMEKNKEYYFPGSEGVLEKPIIKPKFQNGGTMPENTRMPEDKYYDFAKSNAPLNMKSRDIAMALDNYHQDLLNKGIKPNENHYSAFFKKLKHIYEDKYQGQIANIKPKGEEVIITERMPERLKEFDQIKRANDQHIEELKNKYIQSLNEPQETYIPEREPGYQKPNIKKPGEVPINKNLYKIIDAAAKAEADAVRNVGPYRYSANPPENPIDIEPETYEDLEKRVRRTHPEELRKIEVEGSQEAGSKGRVVSRANRTLQESQKVREQAKQYKRELPLKPAPAQPNQTNFVKPKAPMKNLSPLEATAKGLGSLLAGSAMPGTTTNKEEGQNWSNEVQKNPRLGLMDLLMQGASVTPAFPASMAYGVLMPSDPGQRSKAIEEQSKAAQQGSRDRFAQESYQPTNHINEAGRAAANALNSREFEEYKKANPNANVNDFIAARLKGKFEKGGRTGNGSSSMGLTPTYLKPKRESSNKRNDKQSEKVNKKDKDYNLSNYVAPFVSGTRSVYPTKASPSNPHKNETTKSEKINKKSNKHNTK